MSKIEQAKELAEKMIREHGLVYDVNITNHRLITAQTNHTEKVINISRFFIKLSTLEDFKGVILHEITHALLGYGHGHNDTFMKLCKEIGGYAEVSSNYAIGKYIGKCDECGQRGGLNSKRKQPVCGICIGNDKISLITIKKNEIKETVWHG